VEGLISKRLTAAQIVRLLQRPIATWPRDSGQPAVPDIDFIVGRQAVPDLDEELLLGPVMPPLL